MMKKAVLPLLLVAFCIPATHHVFAQAPAIEWQKSIGGSLDDHLNSIQQTTDGGYIIGGSSASPVSGNKTAGSAGAEDYWIVKLDNTGAIEWQKTFGGSDHDYLRVVRQTAEGGYLLGGSSASGISGDKTEASWGGTDYWVLKLDNNGTIEWQNSMGGKYYDDLFDVEQTSDSGYIVGGRSGSGANGDKTELASGNTDFWVIKLTPAGSIEWQNTIGGNKSDGLSSLQQTTDGGYILGGVSKSDSSGDKTEDKQGSYDYWVVKLDSSGSVEWDNTAGGKDNDWLHAIQQTTDGGYILGGESSSKATGDKSEKQIGEYDYWVVKLNSAGSIEWENTIGGKDFDWLNAIQQTSDGGYILAGESASGISGDKTATSSGGYDYWIIKLNHSGKIEWQQTIGGTGIYESATSIRQTNDEGFIIGGSSDSGISGDKSEDSFGHEDYWIIKLLPFVCNGTTYYADTDHDGYGDAGNSYFSADCSIPEGYVPNATDCNDGDAAVNVSAVEMCFNTIDDNCSGVADENCVCTVPVNLTAGNITATSAQLNWYSADNAKSYKFRYKIKLSDTWIAVKAPTHTAQISDLIPGTAYAWQVKSRCAKNPDVVSEWSKKEFFTTAPLKAGSSLSVDAFEVYPNPASAAATVHFNLSQSSFVTITICDINGKEIQSVAHQIIDEGDHFIAINVSPFSKGIYLVKMISEEKIFHYQFIVQ